MQPGGATARLRRTVSGCRCNRHTVRIIDVTRQKAPLHVAGPFALYQAERGFSHVRPNANPGRSNLVQSSLVQSGLVQSGLCRSVVSPVRPKPDLTGLYREYAYAPERKPAMSFSRSRACRARSAMAAVH